MVQRWVSRWEDNNWRVEDMEVLDSVHSWGLGMVGEANKRDVGHCGIGLRHPSAIASRQ